MKSRFPANDTLDMTIRMHFRRITFSTILALAALPTALAQAAPHWSVPKQIVAPPSGGGPVAAPQALVGPGGTALGFGGDGQHPLAFSGTIAGGLTAKPIAATATGTARGAAGADGTIAAVWSDNTQAHLAIAPPGGAFGTPIDLPGTGVNSLAVAVSPDGTTTVAWRTKATSPGVVYEVLAAQVPKGGAALGTPQVLETGKSGISYVAAAAGADGAVAVSYGRQATVSRTKVAVKPAGAAAFEAPQAVSSDTKSDIGSSIAFEKDGTIVAAWGNPDAGQVALRRPGQTAFAAPVSLGAPAYSIDLEPTPQGVTAVAFAAGGDIRAAVQAADGSFAPVVVGPAPGNIPPQPAIAVDGAGAATVLYADSTDGAVRATILGGATTTIGYGKPGGLTPVAVAAGGASQAFALWSDAGGGTSQATYGDDAPAGGGPGTKPALPDTRKPKAKLLTVKAITVTKKTVKIKLRVSCDEACKVGIASNLRTTLKGKKRIAPIRYLDYRKAPLRPAGTQTVTLTLGKIAVTDLRKALRAGRGAQVFLSVSVYDKAENNTELRGRVTLRAAKKASAKKR